MEWHYAVDGEKQGPVSATELLTLKERGIVEDNTLVWAESLTDWTPFSVVRARMVDDIQAADPDLVECAVSGKLVPRSEALEFGDQFILPEHKDRFVQRLSEGAGIGTVQGGAIDKYGAQLNFNVVLSRTWDIYRGHFLLLLAIHLTVWLPLNQISAYADTTLFTTGDVWRDIRNSINLGRILNGMIGIISIAAIFQVCIRVSKGQVPTYGNAMSTALRLWGKFWITRFIQGFFLVVGVIIFAVPIGILAAMMNDSAMGAILGLFIFFLALAGFIGLLWYVCRIAFTLPFMAETGTWGMEAIRKSFTLTRGRIWLVLGYFILLTLIILIPVILPILPSAIPPLDHFVAAGLMETTSGIVAMFGTVFTFAFYKQLRISIGEDGQGW